MAKLLSNSYGSSPNCSFFNDWIPNHPIEDLYNGDNSIIPPDPTELFEDLNLSNWQLASIHSDIQKIESSEAAILGADCFDSADDIKPEIRNIDCMWSATSVLSTSVSSSLSDSVAAGAVPLAAVTGNVQNINNNIRSLHQQQQQQQQQHRAPTVVVANNSKLHALQSQQHVAVKTEIKSEPITDDYEQQLQQHSIPNSRTAQQSMQHIPPGTSLLRKSNTHQQQLQQQQKKLQQQQKYVAGTSAAASGAAAASIQIPKMYPAEFLRERDPLPSASSSIAAASATIAAAASSSSSSSCSSLYMRPDTPHSLDDDVATEFKHNVDLRACVMGSNNISLTADPTNFINHVSAELQDTSKSQIDISLVPGCASLAEVLDVIVKDHNSNSSHNNSNTLRMSSTTASASHLRGSDFGDSDEDDESTADSSCGSSSLLEDGDLSAYAAISPVSSQLSNISSSSSSSSGSSSSSSSSHQQQQQPYLHSDHSYTRCKDGMDDLGPSLETPSDSEEEIDVVSINDKKLPTNPSDKDRRALQTKVAYKFSNARIVKTANGVRTIPPRRRISYDLPYTPASSSPVKSVANSRYPSPASTPYQSLHGHHSTAKYVQQQQNMLSGGLAAADGTEKSRKRVNIVNGIEYALPPSKKHRGKKTKHHGAGNSSSSSNAMTVAQLTPPMPSSGESSPGSVLQREFSVDEAADTLEKRNLHNDMERQRRIGLKNLFEALKKQIPSIKDKERAPKVNILREAAKLCESLTREDQQLNEQKAALKEQLRKRQDLLARLRALQRD